MPRKKKKQQSYKKPFLMVLVLIVLIGGGLYVWHDHTKSLSAVPTKAIVVGTPSKPIQQHQSQPSSTATTQGGVVDQNGKTTDTLPASSDWISSANGDITVQQPTTNTTIQSGAILSGLANVSNVAFNLTDNSVGLIAQGTLAVVNGKFSGTLQFTPHAGTGTLQVYYPDPGTGAEQDVININVNFSS
jgi:cytoskeletal protein RodZ